MPQQNHPTEPQPRLPDPNRSIFTLDSPFFLPYHDQANIEGNPQMTRTASVEFLPDHRSVAIVLQFAEIPTFGDSKREKVPAVELNIVATLDAETTDDPTVTITGEATRAIVTEDMHDRIGAVTAAHRNWWHTMLWTDNGNGLSEKAKDWPKTVDHMIQGMTTRLTHSLREGFGLEESRSQNPYGNGLLIAALQELTESYKRKAHFDNFSRRTIELNDNLPFLGIEQLALANAIITALSAGHINTSASTINATLSETCMAELREEITMQESVDIRMFHDRQPKEIKRIDMPLNGPIRIEHDAERFDTTDLYLETVTIDPLSGFIEVQIGIEPSTTTKEMGHVLLNCRISKNNILGRLGAQSWIPTVEIVDFVGRIDGKLDDTPANIKQMILKTLNASGREGIRVFSTMDDMAADSLQKAFTSALNQALLAEGLTQAQKKLIYEVRGDLEYGPLNFKKAGISAKVIRPDTVLVETAEAKWHEFATENQAVKELIFQADSDSFDEEELLTIIAVLMLHKEELHQQRLTMCK